MTEGRWYDERFIKCPGCKQVFIAYTLLGEKFFNCTYCNARIKNKEYFKFMKKEN